MREVTYACEECQRSKRVTFRDEDLSPETEFIRCVCSENQFVPHQRITQQRQNKG